MRTLPIFILLAITFFSCNSEGASTGDSSSEDVPALGLKDAYADDFLIGAALSAPQIMGKEAGAGKLMEEQFNSFTPENMMKWMHIHPASDTFNFEVPDKLVEMAEAQDKHLVGHTLVWHSQLAPWVSEVTDASALTEVLENHINTIVGHYKGKIEAWDVVNEALNEDGTLRETVFLKQLGEDYLPMVYKMAAAVDPEAELYYNDYNLCVPAKREGCVELVKLIQDAGAKIDGVGMQGHWNLNGPSLEEIENSILAYHELGVKVMITELDITVLPNPWDLDGANVNQRYENNEMMNPYPDSLPDSVQQQLAKRYEDVFRLFLKHSDKISRVTFWGVHDGHSWLNNWPIPGRTNYPLVFDRNYQPKLAYERLMALPK